MWKYNCTLFCSMCSVNRVEQFMTSFISYGFFKDLLLQCHYHAGVNKLFGTFIVWISAVMLSSNVMGSSSFIHLLSMFSCRYYKSMNAYKIDIRLGCIYTSVPIWLLWRWQIVNAPIVLSSIILWFKGLSHWSKL